MSGLEIPQPVVVGPLLGDLCLENPVFLLLMGRRGGLSYSKEGGRQRGQRRTRTRGRTPYARQTSSAKLSTTSWGPEIGRGQPWGGLCFGGSFARLERRRVCREAEGKGSSVKMQGAGTVGISGHP
ncbi:Hypothetical predicted protein [Podarcis lilfordi]|uniref:Uncharacterized protein n=1 Tax=Podarcis lilfordi TaxID=74358 RepID=A0AA35PUA3_9SAUR|nr:Hypothetical predicted protein [Podarcis lilfordi]